MGEGGGGEEKGKVSLLQLSLFFASIFPLFSQKRLILRLPANSRRISGRRFSPSEIFRRERRDDRKCVCCSQANLSAEVSNLMRTIKGCILFFTQFNSVIVTLYVLLLTDTSVWIAIRASETEKREKFTSLRFNRQWPFSGLGDTRKTNIRLCSDRFDRRLVSSVWRAPVSLV